MSSQIELIAESREDAGKGASRRLRRQGKLPAVLYGGGRPPRSLTLDHQSILHQMENEAFYSSILSIRLGDQTQSVVIRDVQRHPAKRAVLHLDFLRIQADEAIRMTVPIHFPGEDVAKGVKLGGGLLSRMTNEVEIECLPKDLPEYLELDVTELDMDEILHLSDIKLPAGVEIPGLVKGEQSDQPVVAIHRPRAEEVEAPGEIEGTTPEVPSGQAADSGDD
jgi:large subunit ribosomal protein L25